MQSGILLLFLILSAFLSPLYAQSQPDLELFASGLDSPIGIVNAGDARLFVIEQRGHIQILDEEGTLLEAPFLDLSDVVSRSGFETGLLGLAFHPDYSENGYFYVNYTRQTDGATVVARFTADSTNPDQADRESEVLMFSVAQPYANHNGGQLLFGPDGYLYIAFGDGGSGGDPQDNGQDLTTMLGKLLRIDVNADNDSAYVIPPDNPFVNDEAALDEIWAYGLRNPWRNSFDSYTGDLWIADVGQNEFEEVNFQPATSNGGENYGWRCYESHIPFNTADCADEANYVFPVYDYPHAGQGCSGSVTGGHVYRGALYSGMFGKYIAADFCTGNVYTVTQTSGEFEGTQAGNFGGNEVAAFGEDQYGELYVVLQNSGEIHKLVETGECNPVALIIEADSALVISPDSSLVVRAFYNPALSYQWHRNDEPIEGEVQHELEIMEEGNYTVHVTNPENECTNVSEPLTVNASATSVALTKLNRVMIFPNPVSGILRVGGLPSDGKSLISLYDSNGTSLFKTTGDDNSILIPVNRFPAGLYHLRIIHDAEIFHEKVLIR